jgi:hypothetical protein
MTDLILAIDPGTEKSAYVVYDGTMPRDATIVSNSALLTLLYETPAPLVVCEMLACYGMPVGAEVFETAYMIGQIMAAQLNTGGEFARVYRQDVKLHLCGTPRAKDPHVRQAIMDRWGGKKRAVGRKAAPGPLYGISSHCWAALGVAVTWWETKRGRERQSETYRWL